MLPHAAVGAAKKQYSRRETDLHAMDNTKKSKFNIVDTFVVIILLALILGAVYFVLRESGTIYAERNEKNITYTVCISGVEEEYLSSFVVGEKMLNSETLNYIGTITKVEALAAKENGDKALPGTAEGEYVLEQKEKTGVYDVYITLTAKTRLDSRGIAYLDYERITIGSPLYIRSGNFAAESYITAFSLS